MGYLYRPELKSDARSEIWWAKYYVNGRPVRESPGVAADTKTAPEGARRFLKGREGRVATGRPILPRSDRVRYDEVAADLRQHYEATRSRDLDEADHRLEHPKNVLRQPPRRGNRPGRGDRLRAQAARGGASRGTINRELAILSRMLRLAYENGKVPGLPVIRKLKEAAPPSGFFERGPIRGAPAPASGPPGRRGDRLHLRLADAERGRGPRAAPARPGRHLTPGPRHDEERRGAHSLPPP